MANHQPQLNHILPTLS